MKKCIEISFSINTFVRNSTKKDYTSIATLLEISIVIMPSHISDIIILVRVGHIF